MTAVLRPRSVNGLLDGQGIILRRYATVAISPDGSTLYVCTDQAGHRLIMSYSVATKARLQTLASFTGEPGDCAFTLAPSGQQAMIADSADQLARLNVDNMRLTAQAAASLPGTVRMTW